jgi:hypothetical protein
MASLLFKSIGNFAKCAPLNLSNQTTLCSAMNKLFIKNLSTETTSTTNNANASSPTLKTEEKKPDDLIYQSLSSTYGDESEEVISEEEKAKQENIVENLNKKRLAEEALANHPFNIAKAVKMYLSFNTIF